MTKTSAKITKITRVSANICVINLQPSKKFSYKAGQYLQLSASDHQERPYSIASAPQDDGHIELHIRQSGELSTYLCQIDKVGSDVEINGPYGTCTYKAQCKKPILAIALGTGLAQISPLVDKALSTSRENPIYLYHGAKERIDLYLENQLQSLAKKDSRLIYRPVLLEENDQKDNIKYGSITEHIKNDFEDLKNFRSYLSGNPEVIQPLKDILVAKGIDPNRIHSDC